MQSPLERAAWRIVRTPPASGAWNMAVDEAILDSVGQGAVLPTFRLYAWTPPCLSLGYSQSIADVDLEALNQNGWQLVRRPTGGKAILHVDELTYSVIAPLQEPRVSGSVLESYNRLSRALINALNRLGLPAEAHSQDAVHRSPQAEGPVCFEVPSNYEITVHGKKLVGSAQARRKDGVLQHGSLPLWGDLTRITRALNFTAGDSRQQAASRLLGRAANAQLLGLLLNWDEAADAFEDAFAETLNIDFQPGELTPGEKARAAHLVETKYAHPSWTNHIP